MVKSSSYMLSNSNQARSSQAISFKQYNQTIKLFKAIKQSLQASGGISLSLRTSWGPGWDQRTSEDQALTVALGTYCQNPCAVVVTGAGSSDSTHPVAVIPSITRVPATGCTVSEVSVAFRLSVDSTQKDGFHP
jgi:hypothetical protein